MTRPASSPRLGDVDVLVSMGFSAVMAEAAPRLRLVQVPGAGLDRIDRGALGPGTHLANAYGHEAGIAEYIIGAMIALTRSFGRLDAKMRRGEWESQWALGTPAPPLWPELAGKTLGILGFGHIGQALARRAAAFDMQVCAIRRQAQAETPAGVSFVGGPERLDEVLRLADYLAVTLSLSAATRNLIDERRLQLMKPSAFLVNVARAEIFDEAAPLRGAGVRQARRRGARCLVPLSDLDRADAAGHAALSRARQCDHDSAYIRLDGRHARGAGHADRRQHRADGTGRIAPQRHQACVLTSAAEGRRSSLVCAPAVLLRLADRRRGVRHHGDRRQRPHRLLAPAAAADRRIRLASRRRRRRLLLRLPVLRRPEPDRGPRDGPPWPPRGDRKRRVPAGGRAFPRPPDQGTLAALCDARRPGRRRRQPHDLHRAVALPAQLVRAPPRPGHQHRLHRSRHRRHRAAALAAGDHRPGRLARLVLGHGPAGASRARSAELLRAAQAAGYRPVAGRGIDRARDRQAAQRA